MAVSSDTIINDVLTIQEQFVVQLITCNLFKLNFHKLIIIYNIAKLIMYCQLHLERLLPLYCLNLLERFYYLFSCTSLHWIDHIFYHLISI